MRKLTLPTLLAPLMLAAPVVFAATAEQKQTAFETVDKNAQQIFDISNSIFYFAELGMQEVESTKLVQDTLKAAGFRVELGGAGMPTNLWAEYGEGRPKIAVVTELDALPGGSQTPGAFDRKPLVEGGPGHMEGHNTHGGVASAAAFAVKQAMQRYGIKGTVALSFGPNEERLREPSVHRARRLFQGCRRRHLSPHPRRALDRFLATRVLPRSARASPFHGKTAHGAVNQWDGRDAVDCGRADRSGLRRIARASAADLSRAPHDHEWRHPAQCDRRHRRNLVVRTRRQHAGREGDL